MKLQFSEGMVRAIDDRFEANLQAYPAKRREVEDYLRRCDGDTALCLRALYGHMHVNDLVTYAVAEIDAYVQATLRARDALPYLQTLPEDLFLAYVLPPRVNNENLDLSRGQLFEALLPLVQGKTMTEAALEVNYWCFGRATYIGSDDRTIAPSTMLKSTLGRCGEESVFTTSALRSVGLPARQCYVPRWSHCDDNHAWVEVWADGAWHYLGACEPEPVLDRGWFTAAASKAMLVHAKAWSTCLTGGDVAYRTALYTLLNTTDTYAPTAVLEVSVTDGGMPVSGAAVRFCVVNYSELFPIYETETDGQGVARFRTGLGGLYVETVCRDRVAGAAVDLRETRTLTLELRQGDPVEALPLRTAEFRLRPPAEHVPDAPADEQLRLHKARVTALEAQRQRIWQSFCHDAAGDDFAPFRVHARGNLPALEAFLALPQYSDEDKRLLLETLRPKDFMDLTVDMLQDALDGALPYRARLDRETWQQYVLAPRVDYEMLLPHRAAARAALPQGFAAGRDLWAWIQNEIQVMPDYGVRNWYPSLTGVLTHRRAPAYALGVVFVQLCRTFGIPARRNPNTLAYEWAEATEAGPVFHPVEETPAAPARTVPLTLTARTPTVYDLQFTLARFTGCGYQTQRYEGLTVSEPCTLRVVPGDYQLLTTVRQIDGSVSTRLERFPVAGPTEKALILPKDETAQCLQSVSFTLPEGPIARALAEQRHEKSLFLAVAPGQEPTEHLLRELLDCQADFRAAAWPIAILTDPEAQLENPTLREVLRVLPTARLLVDQDAHGLDALHRQMGVGDQRLPFALALDAQGRGCWASANYNIRTAQTLYKVLTLAEG